MSEILNSAIVKVQNAKYAFCRFITANDTGKNGSHQAGFYIPKCAAALLFDTPGVKGENKDKMVKVKCMGHRTKRFFQWSEKMGERF